MVIFIFLHFYTLYMYTMCRKMDRAYEKKDWHKKKYKKIVNDIEKK